MHPEWGLRGGGAGDAQQGARTIDIKCKHIGAIQNKPDSTRDCHVAQKQSQDQRLTSGTPNRLSNEVNKPCTVAGSPHWPLLREALLSARISAAPRDATLSFARGQGQYGPAGETLVIVQTSLAHASVVCRPRLWWVAGLADDTKHALRRCVRTAACGSA